MEGSLGTERQHHSLDRVKARTEGTEVLWVFFGVHTANAVRMGKRTKATEGPPPGTRPAA